jgi:hypothetical protein
VTVIDIHKYVSVVRPPKMALKMYGLTTVPAPSVSSKTAIENEAIIDKKVMNAESHTIIPLLETINVHLFFVEVIKQGRRL